MHQDIRDQGKGWQTTVQDGGTAYVADIINIHPPQPQRSATGIPHNLPYSGVPEFVGRADDLERLHEIVQLGTTVAISAISGMGGVGKTELALQYAYHHLELQTYPGGICWLRAREELGTQIVTFAQTGLDLSPQADLELAAKVQWCWQHWRAGVGLIIFDDVQNYAEIKPFLPPAESRFRVVLTTRLKLGSPVRNYELEVLTEAAALDLLRSLVTDGRIDQQLDEAKRICEWLGYLPLGLELVGRYLAQKPDTSLATLWQRLQAKRLEAQALKQAAPEMTAPLGVAAAFELSWETLDEPARRLAGLLSLFALAEIPWALVRRCFPKKYTEKLEDRRDQQLLGGHLLQRTNKGIYQLHQLLREFFIAKRSQMAADIGLKQTVCRVIVIVAKQMPISPTQAQIKLFAPVIPHLEEVATTLCPWLTDADLIMPATRVAQFYEGQIAYESALPWYQRCLEMAETRLGEDHPDVASSLNNLAGLYKAQGRYAEAEPLYARSLRIYEQQLGATHPDVATSLNNLALLYHVQGRYADAEPLYVRSLSIREEQLGATHSTVAQSLNNLALLYESQGRYTEAEPLYERSLAIYEQQLGATHPAVATSLNNLAGLYKSQGRYAEAEPLYLRALDILFHGLGENHPHTQTVWRNFCYLVQQAVTAAQAGELSDHPTTQTILREISRQLDNGQ